MYLMSLNFKDQEVDLGLGIVLAGENTDLCPHYSTSPKDNHSNFFSYHENDQSCVSFPQNLALTGDKYEWACVHWTTEH